MSAAQAVRITLGIVATLALTGCSTPTDAPTSPPEAPVSEQATPEPMELQEWRISEGPVTWTCEDTVAGATLTFTLPAEDERVDRIDAYREKVGVDPVGYILVEIDATEPTTEYENTGVTLQWTTDDGGNGEGQSAFMPIGDWGAAYDESTNYDYDDPLHAEGNELYDEFLSTTPNPGGKGFEILVTEDPAMVESMIAPMGGIGWNAEPCSRD